MADDPKDSRGIRFLRSITAYLVALGALITAAIAADQAIAKWTKENSFLYRVLGVGSHQSRVVLAQVSPQPSHTQPPPAVAAQTTAPAKEVSPELPSDRPPPSTYGDAKRISAVTYLYQVDGGRTERGEFRKSNVSDAYGDFWTEHRPDRTKRTWHELTDAAPGRIRLEDGKAIVDIEPSTNTIYYTDPGWKNYPDPQPIYTIQDVR